MQPQDILALLSSKLNISPINPAEIVDEAIVIANFTILWNIYESRYFRKQRHKESMIHFVNEEKYTISSNDDLFNKFKERYNNSSTGKKYFSELKLSESTDNKDLINGKTVKQFVRDTLNNESTIDNKPSIEDKTIAMLSIIYRLRNNLFHGEKDLRYLTNEVQPLVIANDCLLSFIQRNNFLVYNA